MSKLVWFMREVGIFSMAGVNDRKDLEDLGSRFGSKLKLSEKELGGISIQRKDVEGALLGLQYTMIAEVFSSKEMNGEIFIDCFMSLWRGRERGIYKGYWGAQISSTILRINGIYKEWWM